MYAVVSYEIGRDVWTDLFGRIETYRDACTHFVAQQGVGRNVALVMLGHNGYHLVLATSISFNPYEIPAGTLGTPLPE